jgi:hypothetical protein
MKRKPSNGARHFIRRRVVELREKGISSAEAIRRAVNDARRRGFKTR